MAVDKQFSVVETFLGNRALICGIQSCVWRSLQYNLHMHRVLCRTKHASGKKLCCPFSLSGASGTLNFEMIDALKSGFVATPAWRCPMVSYKSSVF